MSKQCDIVRDLLPLYVDGVCSEASSEMVKKHIASCPDCHTIFEQMCSHTNEELLQEEKEGIIERHEKKEKKKKLLMIVSAALSPVIIFMLWYSVVFSIANFTTRIHYRESSVYSKEDMDAAIEKIKENFSLWQTENKMHSIAYTDDSICESGLEYCNSFGKVYDECIVFQVRFRLGTWGFNDAYHDESCYLGRTENGEWELVKWSAPVLNPFDIPFSPLD